MAVVAELLRAENDGSLSFGNHQLQAKAKVEDFKHAGDVYKVKTYNEITKLEKNGMFLYESVPGTSVLNFSEDNTGVSFVVEGDKDAQITIGLEDNAQYEVQIGNEDAGTMATNVSGKINLSVELEGIGEVKVKLIKK